MRFLTIRVEDRPRDDRILPIHITSIIADCSDHVLCGSESRIAFGVFGEVLSDFLILRTTGGDDEQ
jgi:hypothetical protein